MRITTSPQLDASDLSANEQALVGCETALCWKDKGNFESAQEAMRSLWKGVGERPEVSELHVSVAAEVLLCAGILTGWIGGRNEIGQAQEIAKNLITESITYFESVGDAKKIAEAQSEIGACYLRQGALSEAQLILREALKKLTVEGNTRAKALLRLAIVEWSASRHLEALRILTDNRSLFSKITSHGTKGAYHNQLAMVLRNLAAPANQVEYFREALLHYERADHYFKLAQHIPFRADVKNNTGNVLRQLSRFKEAIEYVRQARRLALSVKDKVGAAQFDDTRAQILIAQRKFKEAEIVARGAVSVLEKCGQQCLLADALVTHGTTLARLKRMERAHLTFQRAVEIAREVGALNKAGLAALSLIEEVEHLSPRALQASFVKARRWLAESQSNRVLTRLAKAAEKVVLAVGGELSDDAATEVLLTKHFDLHEAMQKHERSLIKQALAKATGSVTHAASLLGLSHQGLAYVIQARHPDLLKERSPIRRRPRKDR